MGYIYILTNPSFPEWVKIGYADNVNRRVDELNRTTATPFAFRVYATYEVNERLGDLKIHDMIDKLNPNLRSRDVVKGKERVREFFQMTKEDAYSLFEAISEISGTKDKLYKAAETSQDIEEEKEAEEARKRKPNIDFFKCGLKIGDELVYIEDSSVVAVVESAHKVSYNGTTTSLSRIVMDIKNIDSIAGPSYFTFNGRPLVEIAYETQWKDYK